MFLILQLYTTQEKDITGSPRIAESVDPNDLADHTPKHTVRIKLLAYCLKTRNVLQEMLVPSQRLSKQNHRAYSWVDVLGRIPNHFTTVLRPVRSARELVCQCLGEIDVF
jgi:hypothetical protein